MYIAYFRIRTICQSRNFAAWRNSARLRGGFVSARRQDSITLVTLVTLASVCPPGCGDDPLKRCDVRSSSDRLTSVRAREQATYRRHIEKHIRAGNTALP
jgi:hypothetical protein